MLIAAGSDNAMPHRSQHSLPRIVTAGIAALFGWTGCASGTISATECPPLTDRPDYRLSCALVVLPTDPLRKGPRDTLFLAIRRAPTARAPVIAYLPGNPGLGATQQLDVALLALRDVFRTHDVIFLDGRGTGRSTGGRCRNHFRGDRRYDLEAVASCLATARGVGDVSRFTTTRFVDDLELVRRALAIDKMALYGVSHGGRAAFLYALRYRESVARLVLDSPAPLADVLSHVPVASIRSFAHVVRACASDSACPSPVRDPQTLLDQGITGLRRAPLRFGVTAAVNTAHGSVILTERGLANVVRELLYVPDEWPKVVEVLAAAAARDSTRLGEAIQHLIAGDEARNFLVQLNILCREYGGRTLTARDSAAPSAWQWVFVQDVQAACQSWPYRGEDPAPTDVRVTVPVLAFTGELDPITPPEVLAALPIEGHMSLRLAVVRGGHAWNFHCMRSLVEGFLVRGTTTDRDLPECAQVVARQAWLPPVSKQELAEPGVAK